MNVTSAQYMKDDDNENCSISAVIDGRQWSVPLKADNRHYQAIQEWVAKGNTIQEAD
tara:strand:- start:32 stop:202 length:171 start_codon:yes stop_codon:yes gene_type:complete